MLASRGGTLNIVHNNGVLIFNQSQATNQGTISIVGDDFDGISSRGTANTVINQGSITTAGSRSEGMFTSASAGMFINDSGATITTSGVDAYGINSFSATKYPDQSRQHRHHRHQRVGHDRVQ